MFKLGIFISQANLNLTLIELITSEFEQLDFLIHYKFIKLISRLFKSWFGNLANFKKKSSSVYLDNELISNEVSNKPNKSQARVAWFV